MAPGYFARPLGDIHHDIRLIYIKDAEDPDAIIECTMETTRLSENETPAFIAVSYVWGDPSVTEEILLNGAPLAVTTNLAALLRLLRTRYRGEINVFEDAPTKFWVDAICINQQDLREKGAQVPLMRDIYGGAKYIFSWLGPEAEGSTEALSSLRTMGQEIKNLSPDGDRFEWLRQYPKLWGPESPHASDDHTVWPKIDRIWERPYWKRTWIFQEIVLGKDVLLMCGKATLPWGDVSRVANWIQNIKGTDKQPSFLSKYQWSKFAMGFLFSAHSVRRIELLRAAWHRPEAGATGFRLDVTLSLRILPLTRGFLATNPRDYIYGLLGLTAVDIIPDYSKSVRDVFTEAAEKYLKLYGLTQLLDAGRKDKFDWTANTFLREQKGLASRDVCRDRFSLPSWVPDWSRLQCTLPQRRHFRDLVAANPRPVFYTIDPSKPDILSVTGIQLSTIRDITSESLRDLNTSLPTRAWQLCQDILDKYRDRQYPTKIPPLQALLRLILYDETPGNHDPLEIPSTTFFDSAASLVGFIVMHNVTERLTSPTPEEKAAHFEEYLPKLGLSSNEFFAKSFSEQFLGPGFDPPAWNRPEDALYIHINCFRPVIEGVRRILHQSSFFYTDDEHFGYGSHETQVGDMVCALKGCEFPVILRREGEGFIFVGTCDVQGLVAEGVLNGLLEAAPSLEEYNLH